MKRLHHRYETKTHRGVLCLESKTNICKLTWFIHSSIHVGNEFHEFYKLLVDYRLESAEKSIENSKKHRSGGIF